jgi:hypothetical protein
VKAAAISPRKCLRCTEIAPGKSGSVSPRCVASVRISSATRVRPCRHATFSKCGSSALVSSGFLHAHMSVNSVTAAAASGPHKHSRAGRCCADAHPEEDEERAGVPMHCRQLNRREASPAHAEPSHSAANAHWQSIACARGAGSRALAAHRFDRCFMLRVRSQVSFVRQANPNSDRVAVRVDRIGLAGRYLPVLSCHDALRVSRNSTTSAKPDLHTP